MSRTTNAIGVLFMTTGVVVAIAVSLVMILSRSFSIAGAIILGIAFFSAVFGALFIEPDAAKTALHTIGTEAGPYIPGGRRAGDPIDRPSHDDGEAKG